jgi:hypothetical protein
MKKVQHIVWESAPHDGSVTGLLKVRVFYHGGGSDVVISDGTFTHGDHYVNTFKTITGEISDHTSGVSGISVEAVGYITD